MGDKIRLNIIGLTSSHSQRNSYTLILGEENGELKLPVVIGSNEAQSIALVIEGLKPQRPLTHDLMFDFFEKYCIKLREVIINKLKEGVFFSTLVTEKDGEMIHIDARTSDAIALSLRANCPVFTFKNILNDAGVEYEEEYPAEESNLSDTDISDTNSSSKELKTFSIDELEIELEKALNVEDYGLAAKIRDEIKARK